MDKYAKYKLKYLHLCKLQRGGAAVYGKLTKSIIVHDDIEIAQMSRKPGNLVPANTDICHINDNDITVIDNTHGCIIHRIAYMLNGSIKVAICVCKNLPLDNYSYEDKTKQFTSVFTHDREPFITKHLKYNIEFSINTAPLPPHNTWMVYCESCGCYDYRIWGDKCLCGPSP